MNNQSTIIGGYRYRYRLPHSLKMDHKFVKKDDPQDCLTCKIIGSVTMAGLASYSFFLRSKSRNPNHRLFYLVTGLGKGLESLI